MCDQHYLILLHKVIVEMDTVYVYELYTCM